jgi:hypothetical protein
MAGRSTTIAVQRAELLDLHRLQLEAEIAEDRKPTLSQIIRRALDAYAKSRAAQLWPR